MNANQINPATLTPAQRRALNAIARQHHCGRCTHVVIDDSAAQPTLVSSQYGVVARRGKAFFPRMTHTFPSGDEYYQLAKATITLSSAALAGLDKS